MGYHGMFDTYELVTSHFRGDVVMNVGDNLNQCYESLIARGPGQITALFSDQTPKTPLDMRPFTGLRFLAVPVGVMRQYPPGLKCLKIALDVKVHWINLIIRPLLRTLSGAGPLDYLYFTIDLGGQSFTMDSDGSSIAQEREDCPRVRVIFVDVLGVYDQGWLGYNMNLVCRFPGLKSVVLSLSGVSGSADSEQMQVMGEAEVERLNAACKKAKRGERFQLLSRDAFKRAWFNVEKRFTGWSEETKDEYEFLESYQ